MSRNLEALTSQNPLGYLFYPSIRTERRREVTKQYTGRGWNQAPPGEKSKFNLLSQFPRNSKLSTHVSDNIRIKNPRKKRTVYVTINTWNVEIKSKICFIYVIGIYMKIKQDNIGTVVRKMAEKWQGVNHTFMSTVTGSATRSSEEGMKRSPCCRICRLYLERKTHSTVTRHGVWSYILRCSERS
jgi:hypothetical protein